MDIDRIRFSLIKYLKIRLLKIENQIDYLSSNYEMFDRLSIAEKQFATKLNNLNNGYFEDNVINRFNYDSHKQYLRKNEDRLKHATPSLDVSGCSLLLLLFTL